MRFICHTSAALCVLLFAGAAAHGQAGRYVPVPRVPVGGGGHVPHIPFLHGSGGEDFFLIIGVIVGIVFLAVIGWNIGQKLGGAKPDTLSGGSQATLPPSVPPLEDLILQPDEVADKAHKTTRLLEALARQDAAFNVSALCGFVSATFLRVQQCWEARDYAPVRDLLGPSILAKHVGLLSQMRRNGEINRIDELRIRRLEFVHVCRPPEPDRHEVTALITFEAKVYFVNEGSGKLLRGSLKVIPYQEFWVFRRNGHSWRLEAIDRSDESDRLTAANDVSGMTDQDRRNAEEGVIAL
jgi:predicted lipid-binding transport protein (Tim44 family)